MSSTGRKINYLVRPAKNIERKLIRDCLLRLSPYHPPSNYRYIGFGSKYFTDFVMMHRYLHIDDMVSIEADDSHQERYEFNKPFNCIDLKFGHSNRKLPRLSYEKKTIAWLDYDGPFSQAILDDTATYIKKAQSGSVFLISYNSTPYDVDILRKQRNEQELRATAGLRIEKLKKKLGSATSCIPADVDDREMSKWGYFSKVLKRTFDNQVEATLTEKNANCDGNPWDFKQFLFIDYRDGVEMSTIGGVLFRKDEKDELELCGIDSMNFSRTGDDSCVIKVPNFTPKETRVLLENMPIDVGAIKNLEDDVPDLPKGIFTQSDVVDFIKFYKYFPVFNELEYI